MRESCTAVVTDLSTRIRPDSVPQSLSEQWFASDQAVRVQVAYRCGTEGSEHVYDRVTASVMVLVDDHEIAANCWRVMEVAAPLVRYPESGGVYEIDVPGLVPDRLDPLGRFGARFLPDQWQSLVVELTTPLDPGSHTLDIRFVDDDGLIADATQRLEVVSVTGPWRASTTPSGSMLMRFRRGPTWRPSMSATGTSLTKPSSWLPARASTPCSPLY